MTSAISRVKHKTAGYRGDSQEYAARKDEEQSPENGEDAHENICHQPFSELTETGEHRARGKTLVAQNPQRKFGKRYAKRSADQEEIERQKRRNRAQYGEAAGL